MKYKKKLIEVTLPLEAINSASAAEKGNPFLRGHPRNLHQWWARRPQAAARAILFAQLVDDPSEHPDLFKTEKDQDRERKRLFTILEALSRWENSDNQGLLKQANDEILQSWRYTCATNTSDSNYGKLFNRNKLPVFHDPFAGGGAIPLEAQRLGLESYASDLNPVAVTINKALIEIPPLWSGCPPINPTSQNEMKLMGKSWSGAQGLAEDLRYYGQRLRELAKNVLSSCYPAVEITSSMMSGRPDLGIYAGKKLQVTGWLWARTVKSSNPAYGNLDVPIASSFILSSKVGKEVYIRPVIGRDGYTFSVELGKPNDWDTLKTGTSAGKRAAFKCLMSGSPLTYEYLRGEGKAKRLGTRLMAMIAEGERGKVYLPPTEEMEAIAKNIEEGWKPDSEMPLKHRNFQPPGYGLTNIGDLFTARQLLSLNTLIESLGTLKKEINANLDLLEEFPSTSISYADSIILYIALAIDKFADYNNTICTWNPTNQNIGHLFSKQAIPMAWDFPESSPIYGGLSIDSIIEGIAKTVEKLPAAKHGHAYQFDCALENATQTYPVISTDPPYYDNICYADLSDFFYVWMRKSLKDVLPELFSTLASPKSDELIASPNRHGDKEKAEHFFLEGMTKAMHRLAVQAHPAFPVTIYYAFKQSEDDGDDGTTNTGWDTFLEAVIRAGFSINGTWPIRTERSARSVSIGSNALASSIVLVCRKKDSSAQVISRGDFLRTLKSELPIALKHLQAGNIAPVDLAQAAIGPGMSVYTRFSKVIDANGNSMSVRAALSLINQTLDESLSEQEVDFDPDSRWALTWFEQHGFTDGEYGTAEQLSKSKNTSVNGLVDGGVISSKSGKVRLLRPEELKASWNPIEDKRLSSWEVVHQLIRALESGGESDAAILVAKLNSKAEVARELCYRLYMLCERKKRANEAMSYNGLVQSWPEIVRLSRETSPVSKSSTQDLFDQE